MPSTPSQTASTTETLVSVDNPALVSPSDGDPVKPPAVSPSAAVETTVIAPADVTETVKVIRTTVTTTTTQVVQDNAHPDDVHLVRNQETHTTVSVGDDAQPGQQDADAPVRDASTRTGVDIEALLRNAGWENRAQSAATNATVKSSDSSNTGPPSGSRGR